MTMEEATMFIPVGTAVTTSYDGNVVDMKYNGDAPAGKATLFVLVQSKTFDKDVTVTLKTCGEKAGSYTDIMTYTRKPDTNGFVVADLLPKGLKRYVKISVETTGTATMCAGLNFGTPEDFKSEWVDPKVVFAP